MKRKFGLPVAFVLCIASFSFAQVSFKPGLFFGAGVFKLSETVNGVSQEVNSRTGLIAGAVLDISILNMLAIEPGLALSMRGGKKEGGGITTTATISYLTIPIHGHLIYSPLPMVALFATAGPDVGILVLAKQKTEITGLPTTEEDVKNQFSPLEFGLDLGAGIELNAVILRPYIEYTYHLGLTNTSKNVPDDGSVKDMGMEIRAGVKFPL